MTAKAATGKKMDKNLTDRISNFQEQLKNLYVYRIPLKFLCDVGLVNQCFKFNTKYILTLETDMQKLFKTNINQSMDALPTSLDDIACTGASYIMYEQFQLNENFKIYLEGTMQPEHVLRTRIKPTPYQAIKQFFFPAISLVYNKSDEPRSFYDSYNVDLARTKIKSITLEKSSNTHSTFDSIKFDPDDFHNKFLLTRQILTQFVAWYCKGSSIAPLSDYANNPVFQELPTLSKYFSCDNEKILINLRCRKGYTNEIEKLNSNLTFTIKLKVAAAKNETARNWILPRQVLILDV